MIYDPRFSSKPPKLPALLDRKIYKTGQTRGADDDVIFQNCIARNSTVLIPYQLLNHSHVSLAKMYENGFIVLISPKDYFSLPTISLRLNYYHLEIGKNMLVFYETREDWIKYNPINYGWMPAIQRKSPLGGHYVARIPATTASKSGGKINQGFTNTKMKGAGIRVYEYANKVTIDYCRIQLELLFWMCKDAEQVAMANGMTEKDMASRKSYSIARANKYDLAEMDQLKQSRILNNKNYTICPLCLEKLSGKDFLDEWSRHKVVKFMI